MVHAFPVNRAPLFATLGGLTVAALDHPGKGFLWPYSLVLAALACVAVRLRAAVRPEGLLIHLRSVGGPACLHALGTDVSVAGVARPRPGRSAPSLPCRTLLFGLLYFATALLGHLLSARSSAVATVWPASGLYVAALTLTAPRRWWPMLGAAALAYFASDALLLGKPALEVGGLICANAVEAMVGAMLLRTVAAERRGLTANRSMRDLLALGLAALIGPVAGGVIAAAAMASEASAPFLAVLRVWWTADTLGILVATPLALAAVQALLRHNVSRRVNWLESLAALAVAVGGAIAVFWLPPSLWRMPILMLPPVIWVARRGDALLVSLTVALVATCGAVGLAHGPGPLPVIGLDEGDRAAALQIALIVTVAVMHLFATTVEERRAAQARLAQVRVDLEATVAAALRGAEAEAAPFHAITNALPQMVFTTLPDGRCDYVNDRIHEFTGLSKDAAMDGHWHSLLHPSDLKRVAACWRHALQTGCDYEVECRLRHRDGAWRWMLARAVPVRDQDGCITHWFGSLTDIEEIVAAREILARSHDELEQLVEARTFALRETEARLAHAQRMEALGQLAGGVAHDFNNVLQAVQSGAALLDRRPNDAASVRRIARRVMEAADRGASITRRLLAFSRRDELQAEALEASALLAGMQEILGHTLGAQISVSARAEAGLPRLLADKGQLETVLVNLATNARDAMPRGGRLTLSAAAENVRDGQAHPAQLSPGSFVRLAVTDTGSGIPADVLDRVTEPFFTTKPQGKGTGLGLAMAKGFAEQSGGGLAIDSMPNLGTTVTLWLPTADKPYRPAERRHDAPEAHAVEAERAPRILLIDDDPLVREATAEELEDLGFRVLPVASGQEGLDALDVGESVDLVVTDLSMPGMDGITVIRECQRRRPGLPVILLTGFTSSAAELAVGRAVSGSYALLRKPATVNQIRARIDMMLEGHRMAGAAD